MLANALLIFGINKATYFEYCHPDDRKYDFCDANGIDKDSKMVLYWMRKISIETIGEYWSKPLFICPPCMASVWGTIVWFMAGGSLVLWPFYILSLSGLVTLINSYIYGTNQRST
jgi:hypothetical protein